MDNFKEAIQKLEDLKANGFLTEGEFQSRKKELVNAFVLQATSASASPTQFAASGNPISTGANVVKLRGLPYGCTEHDLRSFFAGFKMDPVAPFAFQFNADGKQSGYCFARFASDSEAMRAINTKNRQYLGSRYIEVMPTTEEEIAQRTQPTGATNWVRMRGLPFRATTGDILAFFDGFAVTEASVRIVHRGGRPSGEAFVQFTDEYEAQRALLKDKEPLGMRYIELFLSTQEECNGAIARGRNDPGKGGMGYGMDPFGGMAMSPYGIPIPVAPMVPMAPAFRGAYGGRGGGRGGFAGGAGFGGADNVVRLRGLPFRATEQDIHAFMAGLNVSRVVVVYQGGRPSGEAFVEFRDRMSLEGALQRNRQLMGTRYIEVFQASRGEMSAAGAASFAQQGSAFGAPGFY